MSMYILSTEGDEQVAVIKIKNRTTLTDFSALIRAGLYLSGNVAEATQNGIEFRVTGNEAGTVITVTETKK